MIHNRVPAAPVQEVVQAYLSRQWDISDDVSPVTLLAFRCGIKEDTLYRAVYMGKDGTIDFDLADLLFAKIGCIDLWWGRLNDIYLGAVLTEGVRKKPERDTRADRICLLPGCENIVVPKPGAPVAGPKAKKYCSPKCRSAATQGHRTGKAIRRLWHCKNGHERSPENTKVLPSGTVQCKDCNRERSARQYAKHREKILANLRGKREAA